MKDLYNENCKTFINKIKEDINKCRHSVPDSRTGRLKIVKISILPKVIQGFHAIPIKVPMFHFFFCRNKKIHPKIYMEFQGTLNSQNDSEKEQSSHYLISKLTRTL